MKTILVLAPTPVLPDAIRSLLSPDDFRLLHRTDVADIEPLAKGSFLDACIVDAEGGDVRALWMIEKLRQLAPHTPVIVYKGATWEWEEEAYLKGVSAVLSKPVRGRLLLSMLERFGKPVAIQPPAPRPLPVRTSPAPLLVRPTYDLASGSQQALQVLRRFSEVLTHSLNAEAMLRQFLMFLREIVGINRSTIFLRYSAGSFGITNPDSRQLRPAATIGLVPVAVNTFELSLDSGIGGFLNSTGRVLRRDSDEANDPEIQKEFQLSGAQLAVPILDRQNIVGVAVFDERVTGEPLLNHELELIFHLLEEVGLALKNIWLHDQVVTNHQMMTDVLRELTSACVVIDRDLKILHANKAARNMFNRPGRRGAEIEFADLPAALGSKVYQVLTTGTAIAPFKFHPSEEAQSIYNVSVTPFQQQDGVAKSVLLTVEDRSREEQLKHLEVETANLRLVKTMADRLAHEIGNALVPLSTYQQLLADKYKDPDFRAGLETAMADSVKRISRLTSQMRFLARDTLVSREALPLAQLLEDAFHEAQKYQPLKSANLKMDKREQPIVLAGDRAALKHAVAEVMLNALQANPSNAKVEVRTHLDSGERGSHWVHIDIMDNGPGFSAEALKKVPEPFFTTRNVGLGLGLAVSRKIIETHRGKLEVIDGRKDHPGIVRISLPLDATAA